MNRQNNYYVNGYCPCCGMYLYSNNYNYPANYANHAYTPQIYQSSQNYATPVFAQGIQAMQPGTQMMAENKTQPGVAALLVAILVLLSVDVVFFRRP